MWTLPDAPDGFIWYLVGGQAGHGFADLKLSPGQLLAASVVRWGDVWAFLPGPWAAQSRRDYRVAPSRGRALAWAARWAKAHRRTLEFLDKGPAGPPGLHSPFRLTAPPPPDAAQLALREAGFWRTHYAQRR